MGLHGRIATKRRINTFAPQETRNEVQTKYKKVLSSKRALRAVGIVTLVAGVIGMIGAVAATVMTGGAAWPSVLAAGAFIIVGAGFAAVGQKGIETAHTDKDQRIGQIKTTEAKASETVKANEELNTKKNQNGQAFFGELYDSNNELQQDVIGEIIELDKEDLRDLNTIKTRLGNDNFFKKFNEFALKSTDILSDWIDTMLTIHPEPTDHPE